MRSSQGKGNTDHKPLSKFIGMIKHGLESIHHHHRHQHSQASLHSAVPAAAAIPVAAAPGKAEKLSQKASGSIFHQKPKATGERKNEAKEKEASTLKVKL